MISSTTTGRLGWNALAVQCKLAVMTDDNFAIMLAINSCQLPGLPRVLEAPQEHQSLIQTVEER